MNEPQMMIPWFPFIVLAVVLLFAFSGGRVCRSHRSGIAVAAGIAILGLLLLTAGLLLAAIFLIGRAPTGMKPVPELKVEESYGPLPPAQPRQIPLELDSEPLAEQIEPARNRSQNVAHAGNVPPATNADRPAWMDAETGRIGNVYRTRITVGPYLSRAECEKDLPEALQKAVRDYATRHMGEEKAARVWLPESYIDEHIVRDEWQERRQTTIDELVYLHELLEFDLDAKRRIEASYQQAVVYDRLIYTAAGGGTLLGLLTILFAYLKLDTRTRGLYTGRLRLSATAAILAIAVIAGLLVMA